MCKEKITQQLLDSVKKVYDAKDTQENKEKLNSIDMGIGQIGKNDTVLVWGFRWTLEAPGLSEMWMSDVRFDFVNRVVHISAYEAQAAEEKSIQLHDWLERPVGPIVFTTFTGCGMPIYSYELDNLEKLADTIDFNYATSELAKRKATIFFGSLKKTPLLADAKALQAEREANEQSKVAGRKGRNARRGRKHTKTHRRPKAAKHRS